MKTGSLFSRLLFLCIVSSAIASGCVSFPGKELPTYTPEQIAAPEKKIASSFDVKVFSFDGEDKKFEGRLEKDIQRVLTESRVFAQSGLNRNDSEYHFSFVLRRGNFGNEVLTGVSAFITAFSLTVVPAYYRDIYILTIDVKQGDKVVRTYTYRDHMNTWIQTLLLVSWRSHTPVSVRQSIIDNMTMNFVHDFLDDMKAGMYLVQAK